MSAAVAPTKRNFGRRSFALPIGLLFGLVLAPSVRADKVVRDVTFATVAGAPLKLDLYSPESGAPAGLIVWIHGGAWRAGSRESVDLKGMTARGWAVASVDYRLSTVARFPAQLHDLKAAIRFLRAHAADYGYPADRFVVSGSSAGGHLAALVGVTNGVAALEGDEGDCTGTSSDVQAAVVLYGASNLTTILAQSTPHGLDVRVPALKLLLGDVPDKVPALARLASPVFFVDPSDPPLLLEHGDQDPQMPVNQALELQGAYERAGLPVVLKIMPGSQHGGPAFATAANLTFIDSFLRTHLIVPAQVDAATDAWAAAFNARDPDRVVALYASDAVLWGTTSPTLCDTPAAIRDYFSVLPADPHGRVAIGAHRVRVFGDTAIDTGYCTFSTVRDGQPVTRPARFSFTYRLLNGRWMIVDHHSSAVPPPRK